MSNQSNFDFQGIFDSLREAVSSRLNVLNQQVVKVSKGDLRLAILSSVEGSAKNGKEVIQSIALASGGRLNPSTSEIYPALEELADEGFLAIKIDGERRTYKLTKSGAEHLAETIKTASMSMKSENATTESGSKVTVELLKSSSLLAQAVGQVSQTCDNAKQAEVIEILDEARRKTYAILAQD